MPSTAFAGGFRTPDGQFRGRPAMLVFGQRTQNSAMTARFELPADVRDARLRLTGLDSEDPDKTPIEVVVNDRAIARAQSPFDNDTPTQPQAPWTEREVEIPAGLLRGGVNTLTIRNLTESSNQGPPYVAIHEAVVTYRS